MTVRTTAIAAVLVGLAWLGAGSARATLPATRSDRETQVIEALRQALAALDGGHLERAADLYRQAGAVAQSDEVRYQAALGLGSALVALGRAAEAAVAFEQAVTWRPSDPAALLNLGQVLADLGRDEEGAAVLGRATAAAPELGPAHLALVTVLERLGRHEEAAKAAAEASRLLPDDPRAHLSLGVVLYHLERCAEAVPAFERALALAADNPGAHYGLGLCRLYLGDRRGAVAEVAVLNRLDPKLGKDLYERVVTAR